MAQLGQFLACFVSGLLVQDCTVRKLQGRFVFLARNWATSVSVMPNCCRSSGRSSRLVLVVVMKDVDLRSGANFGQQPVVAVSGFFHTGFVEANGA